MEIYVITNKINGKQYVGMTVRPLIYRIRQHFSITRSGTCFLSKAIAKYGKENFTYESIDTATTKDELKEKEIFWIKKLNTHVSNGYNYQLGGIGGINSAIEKRMRPIKCLDTGEIFKSVSLAAERYGLCVGNVSSVCTGSAISAGGLFFEYIDSDLREKAKINRTAKTERSASNIRNSTLKMNSRKRIKVRCVNTGEVFESLVEASAKTGISTQQICSTCKGKTDSAKGLKFEYLDPDLIEKAKENIKNREIKTKNSRLRAIRSAGNKNRKRIKCISTGEEFDSIVNAAKWLKVNPSSVSLVLRKINKTVKGLTFIYVGEK